MATLWQHKRRSDDGGFSEIELPLRMQLQRMRGAAVQRWSLPGPWRRHPALLRSPRQLGTDNCRRSSADGISIRVLVLFPLYLLFLLPVARSRLVRRQPPRARRAQYLLRGDGGQLALGVSQAVAPASLPRPLWERGPSQAGRALGTFTSGLLSRLGEVGICLSVLS